MKRIEKYHRIVLGVLCLTAASLIGCGSQTSNNPAVSGQVGGSETKTAKASGKASKAVVVGGNEFNFGTTEVGQEFEHVFIVKNEGDADLVCVAGPPSCTTCTSFKIDKEKVPPGDSLRATVKWHIKNPNPEFRQYAPLVLDGGEELKLYVVGKVVKRILMEPSESWIMGDIVEGQPLKFTATLTSATLDKFDVESVKSINPKLTVTPVPMTPEKLKELKVKSGFELVASLEPNIAIGEFADRVAINILDPKPLTLKVDVKAKRTGPLNIFGPNYNMDLATLRLATFDPKDGLVTRLNLFTRGFEGELKFEKIICADDRFSVELKPDTKAALGEGSRRYELFIKVAGSDKPVVYTPQQPLDLEMVTNQPVVGSIKIKIRSANLKVN